MASIPAAVTTDQGASSAQTGSGLPAEPVASPATQQGSVAPSPGATPQESPNMRQLREAYDALKREHDPYKALGKPDEIQNHVSVSQKMFAVATELGKELGYDEKQVRDALLDDPAATYEFLKQKKIEAEKANGGQPVDIKKLLKEQLDKELKPFKDEREQQLIDRAHALFDTAFDQQVAELYKDDKPSEDELDMLYDATFRLLEKNPEIIKQLKDEKKAAGVAQLVAQAKTAIDKYYLARSGRENKRVNPNGNPPAPKKPGEKKFKLDDFIEGNFPEGMTARQ